MIRSLPPDGVVREPGAYRIPIQHYHSQAVCPGPSISSSGLRTIYTKSPADFWAFSELNPQRYEQPVSEAFVFGRAAHMLLLGEDVFEQSFAVRPEEWDSWRTKDSQTWRAEMEAQGLDVLTPADMKAIFRLSCALQDHALVGPLFDGNSEVSLVWQDEPSGIWLKARPDMLPTMGEVIADLKTCSDASLRAISRETRLYGYDMQMALAAVGAEACLGQKINSAVLVFVQKTAPYHVSPLEIDEDALHWAKLKLRHAINLFVRGMESGDWPGPVEGIPKYLASDHEMHEIGQAQERGGFPRDWFGSIGGETEEPADV